MQADAVGFYQTAMHVIGSFWKGEILTAINCLFLAVANNLGHVHFFLGNWEETRECLSLILSLIACPPPCHQMPDDEYDFFYNNTIPFSAAPLSSIAPTA
jgi:hypothetical protein